MNKSFFITGSGTGVGKTLVTAALAHQFAAQGKRVSALKPVISGYSDRESDTATLLAAQGLPMKDAGSISPWRFAAPLAPSEAARLEGREIDLSDVVAFCTQPRECEITLIEGAGGVMAPLSEAQTMLDWMVALDVPVVLVAGTYLGAVSHALTAAELLHARGITLQAVVVSESEDAAMSVVQTASLIRPFVPYAKYVVPLPRVAGAGELWQNVSDLTWMLG